MPMPKRGDGDDVGIGIGEQKAGELEGFRRRRARPLSTTSTSRNNGAGCGGRDVPRVGGRNVAGSCSLDRLLSLGLVREAQPQKSGHAPKHESMVNAGEHRGCFADSRSSHARRTNGRRPSPLPAQPRCRVRGSSLNQPPPFRRPGEDRGIRRRHQAANPDTLPRPRSSCRNSSGSRTPTRLPAASNAVTFGSEPCGQTMPTQPGPSSTKAVRWERDR